MENQMEMDHCTANIGMLIMKAFNDNYIYSGNLFVCAVWCNYIFGVSEPK